MLLEKSFVVQAILNRNGSYRQDSSDHRRLLRELYFELNLHYFLRKILNCFRNEDGELFLRKFGKDEEFKRILGPFSRDELTWFLFKIVIKRSWLASLAFKRCVASFL